MSLRIGACAQGRQPVRLYRVIDWVPAPDSPMSRKSSLYERRSRGCSNSMFLLIFVVPCTHHLQPLLIASGAPGDPETRRLSAGEVVIGGEIVPRAWRHPHQDLAASDALRQNGSCSYLTVKGGCPQCTRIALHLFLFTDRELSPLRPTWRTGASAGN